MFNKLIPWKRHHNSNSDSFSLRYDDDPISNLRREFDNMLSHVWSEGGFGRNMSSDLFRSSVDFDEDDKEYVVTAELPGYDPEDIDVNVSGNLLTVRAEHKQETKRKNGRLHRYGSFYQSFTLPAGVKPDAIDARYHSGLLEVHLPKDKTTPSKRIAVTSS